MQAVNAAGTSVYSKVTGPVMPAPTVPGAPLISLPVTGDGQATVSWTAPASDGGSPISGYVVTAYVGYGPVKTLIFNSTLTTQTITGLTNGTQYRFRVRAYNAVGISGYSKVTNPVTPAVAISALYGWGDNNSGQLGDGTTTNQPSPVQVGTATNWASVAAGVDHTVAHQDRRHPVGLGRQLLRAARRRHHHQPRQPGPGRHRHRLGLGRPPATTTRSRSRPTAPCGPGAATPSGSSATAPPPTARSPAQVGTATNWASVAAGTGHTVAVKTDGTLWAWGDNLSGQLGDGTTTDHSSPVQIGTATNWASVAAGVGHTVAIKTDGTLWAWGGNLYGQLGDGTTTDRSSPVQVGTATNWASVAAGDSFTRSRSRPTAPCGPGATTTSGSWATAPPPTTRAPSRSAPPPTGPPWPPAASHTVAIKTDGTLWAWGWDGTTTYGSSPVPVGAGHRWAAVDASSFFTVAIAAS